MNRKINVKNGVLGCIFGGAIGDCMGGPYEGAAPNSTPAGRPWFFSDDTQMTLATCEAIAASGKVDPKRIASTFAQWFADRRITGSGASTRKALIELAAGAHWALSGRGGDMSAGNGAAMRIAPLAFLLDLVDPDARKTIRDVCRITHRSDEAYAGALAVVAAVRSAFAGAARAGAGFLTIAADALPDTNVRDRLHTVAEVEVSLTVSEAAARFGASGYVVESIPLALLAAGRVHSDGFRKVIEDIVACGGDADTNASIAGQIMGASIGYDAIPSDLNDRLPERQTLTEVTQGFADVVSAQ